MESLGYLGMFFSAFLAATLIPMSSDAIFLGMLMGGFEPVLLTVAASAGNTLGGLTSFYLGYLGKWKWLEKYAGVKKEKAVRFSHKMERYGAYMALVSWLPFIGDLIAVALGFFKVSFWKVAVFMTIGKTARYVTIAFIWPLLQQLFQ